MTNNDVIETLTDDSDTINVQKQVRKKVDDVTFRAGFRAAFRNAFWAHFRKLGSNVVIFWHILGRKICGNFWP